MRAVRVHEHGGPAVLECEEVPRPTPTDAEVLVDVHAAGVNPVDWMVRKGFTDEALDPGLPYVPGWDLSGAVASVGDAVDRFRPGDDVFGTICMPEPGATYAECATAPATHLIEKPTVLTHVGAAGLPMVGLTAWHALFDVGNLGTDDRVLVHAAAGGVGHVAVQLAKWAGAHVVGTASAANERFLRDLGVDRVVDYRAERFEAVVDDVALVVDAVGGATLDRSLEVVESGGKIVTLPKPPGAAVVERAATRRDAAVEWFSVEPDAEVLSALCDRVTAGDLRPTISETYPLSDAQTAQAVSEGGHVRGKLVLTVDA